MCLNTAGGVTPADPVTRRGMRHLLTTQLAVLALCACLSQYIMTTAELWSASYISTDGGATLGAVTFAAMTLGGILAALLVDPLSERLGSVRLLRASAIVAAVGMGTGLAIGTAVAGVVAFIVLGLGLAAVGLCVYTFAGRQRHVAPAEAVSIIELGDSVGALVAPATIGAIAATTGLRASLITIVAAAIGLVVLARRAGAP